MRPSLVMRESMRGADCTLPSRMIARDRPMLSPVTFELRRAFRVEREGHSGAVVLVERRTRAPQIATGHGGSLAHQVVHSTSGGIGAAAHARDHVHTRRHGAAGRQRLFRGRRALLDNLQLEKAGRTDDLFRTVDVGDARQLDQDLVAVRALLRNARLGHAELVHPALNRLACLNDGLFPECQHHVGFHPERVGAVGARVAIEVGADLVGGCAERRVLVGGDTLDFERFVADQCEVRAVDFRIRQQLAEALHLGFALDAERIVGLDAQHEMDATLEVEPEFQNPIRQHLRARHAVARRDDRVHPYGAEDDGDGDGCEQFPAQIGHKAYWLGVSTTAGWPW